MVIPRTYATPGAFRRALEERLKSMSQTEQIDSGKLGYFWEHVYLKATSGPNLEGLINPDSGAAILDSEMQKLTALDFTGKLKVSEA